MSARPNSAAADDIRELEGCELREFGAVHRDAVADPQIGARTEGLHEVDRREHVGPFNAGRDRALEQAERVDVSTTWSKRSTRAPATSLDLARRC